MFEACQIYSAEMKGTPGRVAHKAKCKGKEEEEADIIALSGEEKEEEDRLKNKAWRK